MRWRQSLSRDAPNPRLMRANPAAVTTAGMGVRWARADSARDRTSPAIIHYNWQPNEKQGTNKETRHLILVARASTLSQKYEEIIS